MNHSEELRLLRSESISENSLKVYLNSIAAFVFFLYNYDTALTPNYQCPLTQGFKDLFEIQWISLSDSAKKKAIKEKLQAVPPVDILDFNVLQTSHFMTFLITLKRPNGESLTFSSLNTHRAGFNFLYRLYSVRKPDVLEFELINYFKSLKKRSARAAQNGTIERPTNTKLPLPFAVYKCLARQFFKGVDSNSQDDALSYVFAHLYLVMAWNSMQRASNVQDISLNHLAWADDYLQLYIFVTKSNQDGEKSEHPRHIFANPMIPFICPVLSLGIYFSLVDFRTNQKRLFGGNNQSERFRQFLARCLKHPEIRDSLGALGFDEEKLGIHSTRKGAATYCLSGTTAPPSQASIDNRGGWSQGKVKNVYQHFSEPGDSYVGRLVCGLPRNGVDFAILPPRFKTSTNNDYLRDAVRTCFPTLDHSIFNVAKFALASLVHHADYLREVLPPNHIIFQTILILITGHASSLEDLAATGVPPDVFLHTAIQKVPHNVDAILQERSIAANQVTPEFVTNLLQENYRQIKSIIQPMSSVETVTKQNSTTPHVWGGRFHLLPEDYKIPKTSGRIIWEHWLLGDSNSGIPPLRRVGTQSIQKGEQKRFSDLKYFIKKVTDILVDMGQYVENPSPLQVTQMYEAA